MLKVSVDNFVSDAVTDVVLQNTAASTMRMASILFCKPINRQLRLP